MSRPLYVIRESRIWTPEMWQRFTAKAQADGLPPGPQLARLVRAYLGESDEGPHDDTPGHR